MKVASKDPSIQIISTGVTRSRTFQMSANKVAKSAQILGETLYNNRPLAVIREYSTNAADAHLMAKTPQRPIHVTLPTSLSPIFRVRDFGPGIAENDIYNVYTRYFESTKEDDVESNGFLGLGSKSGFAYADTFTVISITNAERLEKAIYNLEYTLIPDLIAEGAAQVEIEDQRETLVSLKSAYASISGTDLNWRVIYTAYKNGELIPCMDKQHEEATSEETGIEVMIPIDEARNANAISNFNSTALNFYRHFQPTPEFSGNSYIKENIINYQKRKAIYSGETPEGVSWSVYGRAEPSFAVMGNVPYPIDVSLWGPYEDKNRNLILNGGLVLQFPTGMVVNHPSRESLDRSSQTVSSLKRAIKRIMISIRAEGRSTMQEAPNIWTARAAYQNASHMQSYLRNIILPQPLFQGKPITPEISRKQWENILNESLGLGEEALEEFQKLEDNRFQLMTNAYQTNASAIRSGLQVRLYTETSKYATKKMPDSQNVDTVIPSDQLALAVGVLGDIPKNRVAGIMRGAMQRSGHSRMIALLFPTQDSLQKFLDHEQITGAYVIYLKSILHYSVHQSNVNEEARAKHKVKEFVFNLEAKHDLKARSNSWNAADMDLTDGKGFYVLLDKFEIANTERRGEKSWILAPDNRGYDNGNNRLANFLVEMESVGIPVPPVYGIRVGQFSQEKMGSGWKPFGEYVKEEVSKRLVIARQQRANHEEAVRNADYFSNFRCMTEELPRGSLKNLVDMMDEYVLPGNHEAFELDSLTNLMPNCAYDHTWVKPTINVIQMIKDIKNQYPMIDAVTYSIANGVEIPKFTEEEPVWDETVVKPKKPQESRKATKAKKYRYQKLLLAWYQSDAYKWQYSLYVVKKSDYDYAKENFDKIKASVLRKRSEILRYLAGFPVPNE